MIRAVSRCTLEVTKTGSPYFERVICFVRPEYVQNDRLDLHRAAQQLIAAFDADISQPSALGMAVVQMHEAGGTADTASPSRCHQIPFRQRLIRLLPLALSAVVGAGAALLAVVLLR